MAFGRSSDVPPTQQGRYKVETVAINMTKNKNLETALNNGDAQGWKLVEIVWSGGPVGFVNVVWDTK